MLQLELDPRSGKQTAIVRCTGRIVFHEEARTLMESVRALIVNHERVVLDLTAVRDVDSAGLGTFASLHLFARENGSSLVLRNPASRVRNILELTQLDRQLEIQAGNSLAA
jgi:anti-anti-sigma factor